MNTSAIAKGLEKHPENQVENYIAYLNRLLAEKNKQGQLKNPWMINKKEPEIIRFFETVASDGLVFDGIDITLQSTGVSYSYQAYKNKMFIAYPESIIDVNLVYKGDAFNFSKNSGQVNYTHAIDNPFGHNDADIIGAYCVIKNKRGQFLTTLSRPEIDKHRKVAKTDYIWQSWFPEMCMKTVIKKACKQHFKDTYHNIEILDNENSDIEQSIEIEIETKAAIEKITTLEKLEKYWKENQTKQANLQEFNKLVLSRKLAILAAQKEVESDNTSV